MRTVYLTTYLPATAYGKRIRRRRMLETGRTIRIRLAPFGKVDGEAADVPTLFIDGEAVAYMGYPESGEWHSVKGEWWGNGLDFIEEA